MSCYTKELTVHLLTSVYILRKQPSWSVSRYFRCSPVWRYQDRERTSDSFPLNGSFELFVPNNCFKKKKNLSGFTIYHKGWLWFVVSFKINYFPRLESFLYCYNRITHLFRANLCIDESVIPSSCKTYFFVCFICKTFVICLWWVWNTDQWLTVL